MDCGIKNEVVIQFDSFVYSDHLQNVISKGVSESRVFISRASSPERPCVYRQKQKVLRPYSGAEDGAPSLTGSQDDDRLNKPGSLILRMLLKLYRYQK
jgi:hypothetical protein